MTNNTHTNQQLGRFSRSFMALILVGGLQAETRFDFNTDASPLQDGWVAAPLGNGTDGTVAVSTVALGGVTVDSRDRAAGNGGEAEAAMWQDFIFANGSFASAPDSGLQLTLTGLEPSSTFTITLWAFDASSGVQADGFPRNADWTVAPDGAASLSFDTTQTPQTLSDYTISINGESDAEGTLILDGVVALTNPSTSHNVFLNGLRVSDPVLDTDADGLNDSFEQLIIDADDADDVTSLEDVRPEDDFDEDGSSNEEESDRGTDPIDRDTDDDLALDGAEDGGGVWVSPMETGTNPLLPDTDGDGILDGVENPDLSYDPQNPADQPGTDPNLSDSDEDGYKDGRELEDGTDPTDPGSFLDPFASVVAKFDFNAPGSATFAGWTAADSGNGTNGTVTVATEAIGDVALDTRDRPTTNTDGPEADLDSNDLWRDFVFANGSFDTAPGSGLRVTLTGLIPLTTYPITIWAFDDSSNNGRRADWGAPDEETTLLTFPTSPDPSSFDDYFITIEASTDGTGTLVLEGIVAAETPDVSHNVFINALIVGQATGSTEVMISSIEYDTDAGTVALTWNSQPGSTYNVDFSPDLINWDIEIADEIPATEASQTTRFEFSALGLPPKGFFRVRQ